MRYGTKRILAFATVATYLFLSGLENAIILPTAWQYLIYLGAAKEYLLGVTISGFSACAAVSGVIGGRLADAYPQSTKLIVVVAILAMILGNVQYLIGLSVINLIMGRIVCGLGSGAGAALLAEICRTTSVAERTKILSICNGLRQVGLLIGPGFQIVLEYFEFSLFNGMLIVHPFNAPGLFMAVLWSIFLIFVLALYQNLDVEYHYEMLRLQHVDQDLLVGRSVELSASFDRIQNGRKKQEKPSQAALRWYFIEEASNERIPIHPITWNTYIDEFIHDDTVVLFGMTMILFFCQVSIETVIPPLMSRLFGYSSFQTSFIYMIGGCVSISVYFLVALTTRWTSDTYLLLFGWSMHVLGFIWFLICLPQIQLGENEKLPLFAVGVLLLYIGFPVACVGATSLLTKCVSLRVQGIAQGLRRLGTFVGLILGPLWGGATLYQPILQMSVPLTLLLFFAVLFAFSFKKIIKEERLALAESK